MSNFDLNIENYKKGELEELFELPPNYTSSIVEMKETKLRESIFNDKSINDSTRASTLNFLNAAKVILLTDLKATLSAMSSRVYNSDLSLKQSPVTDAGSTFIIEKPTTTYGQSFPSEFYPGTINPLKKRILKQNLNIDTRFRENYYATRSTDFNFSLPIKFSDVMSMQLSAFEMPTTFYAVSKQMGNNFFGVTIDLSSEIISIPDGNYTPAALKSYLNNYVSGANGPLSGDPKFNKLYFTINIDLDADSGSGQMIVGLDEAALAADGSMSIFTFSLNFQTDRYGNPDHATPLPLKFGWMMGFRQGIYKNNYSYVSEGLVDLTGSRYIYLAIDDYNNNVNNGFYSAFNASILNKNILARISMQDGTFNILSQNNLSLITTTRQYFGPVDIQKMNIQLLDEYGRVIDLNNMDYSFCLTFQSVYDL